MQPAFCLGSDVGQANQVVVEAVARNSLNKESQAAMTSRAWI
jgi:hypothetical protein